MKKFILMLTVISSLLTATAQAEPAIWPLNESYKCDEAEFAKIVDDELAAIKRFNQQYAANVAQWKKSSESLKALLAKYGKTTDDFGYVVMNREKYGTDFYTMTRECSFITTTAARLESFQVCREYLIRNRLF